MTQDQADRLSQLAIVLASNPATRMHVVAQLKKMVADHYASPVYIDCKSEDMNEDFCNNVVGILMDRCA